LRRSRESFYTFYRLLLDRNVPQPGLAGGVKGHNMKRHYLTGKPRPVAEELPKDGKPTQNYQVFRKYREQMKEGDSVILKVPQVIFVRRLRRGGGFVENEAYLNAWIFTDQFYKPALEILGPTLTW